MTFTHVCGDAGSVSQVRPSGCGAEPGEECREAPKGDHPAQGVCHCHSVHEPAGANRLSSSSSQGGGAVAHVTEIWSMLHDGGPVLGKHACCLY